MKLNAAMSANVISLIIIGIAALSYVIYDAIKNWNDYGAAMLAIIPGAGWLVETIMMIKTHWESITNAFSSGGMLEGLKAIGVMLLDFILMPLQQILELASNIPGLGDLANIGADKIKGLRASMGIDVTGGAKSETAKDRNVQTQSQQISQSISKNTSQNITNTQTKEVKIVIDNQNQSNIKLNQAYLNGW
jgi:hypothetical protein